MSSRKIPGLVPITMTQAREVNGYELGRKWPKKSWSSEGRGVSTQQEHNNPPVKNEANPQNAGIFVKPQLAKIKVLTSNEVEKEYARIKKDAD